MQKPVNLKAEINHSVSSSIWRDNQNFTISSVFSPFVIHSVFAKQEDNMSPERDKLTNYSLLLYICVYHIYQSAPEGSVCSNNTSEGSNGAWVSRVAQEQSWVNTWEMAAPHCITLTTSQRLTDAAQHSETRRQCATSTPVLCPPVSLNWEAVWKSVWVDK